jgi:hypothetical protein
VLLKSVDNNLCLSLFCGISQFDINLMQLGYLSQEDIYMGKVPSDMFRPAQANARIVPTNGP